MKTHSEIKFKAQLKALRALRRIESDTSTVQQEIKRLVAKMSKTSSTIQDKQSDLPLTIEEIERVDELDKACSKDTLFYKVYNQIFYSIGEQRYKVISQYDGFLRIANLNSLRQDIQIIEKSTGQLIHQDGCRFTPIQSMYAYKLYI